MALAELRRAGYGGYGPIGPVGRESVKMSGGAGDGDIHLAVAVVVGRHRHVKVGDAPEDQLALAVGLSDVPLAGGGTVEGEVRLAGPLVVAGLGNVPLLAERLGAERVGGGLE